MFRPDNEHDTATLSCAIVKQVRQQISCVAMLPGHELFIFHRDRAVLCLAPEYTLLLEVYSHGFR